MKGWFSRGETIWYKNNRTSFHGHHSWDYQIDTLLANWSASSNSLDRAPVDYNYAATWKLATLLALCEGNGPLTRYIKLRDVHAPGMPGTFSRHRLQRKPLVSDPGMHHGTCVTHVPWCMSGSLTRGGGENVPGACATLNFTYLARGPCTSDRQTCQDAHMTSL